MVAHNQSGYYRTSTGMFLKKRQVPSLHYFWQFFFVNL
jgi:hypothetical protein